MQARSWPTLPKDPQWADQLCQAPPRTVGQATIRFSRCFNDPAKSTTLLLTQVEELGLQLEFWISVHPRHQDEDQQWAGAKGFVVRTAQGCSVLPTAGVQAAVDLVAAVCG